jgi:formyltetrahydrofolate deformylase
LVRQYSNIHGLHPFLIFPKLIQSENNMADFVLCLSCQDKPGLVAAVAAAIFAERGNITEAQQFNDPGCGRFFMRVMFTASQNAEAINAALQPLIDNHKLDLLLTEVSRSKRVLLLTSKFDHCLADLLYRHRIGELEMDIVGIASNHPRDSISTENIGEIPFHHLPITKESKAEQEGRIKALIATNGAELIVLARYMQILSDDLAACLSGRCINIHHSFLPGFKGAKPYHQAHARGVKMIGATAHYVTADLDEGPIIHQDVEAITHADTPDDLVRKGRDIERRVLAEAVRLHLQDRVLLNGTNTIVFRD